MKCLFCFFGLLLLLLTTTSSVVKAQTYYVSDPGSDWKTFEIIQSDAISLVCNVGNTNSDSNVCNRSRYIEFWGWNLTYGIVPEDRQHTVNLNGCHFSECEIECDKGCRCIVQATGVSCDAGLNPDGTGYLVPPPTEPPTPPPAAAGPTNFTDHFIVCPGESATITCDDASLYNDEQLVATADIDPAMRACDFAESLFPGWMVKSNSNDQTTSILLQQCNDDTVCGLKCHESCNCAKDADGSACNSCPDPVDATKTVTYNSNFLICGSASATITCPAGGASSTSDTTQLCQYSNADFSSATPTLDAGQFSVALQGCGQSRCAVACIPTGCTCFEPDDGSDCGMCDPALQSDPTPADDNSEAAAPLQPVEYSINFVACQGTTSVITCTGDSNLYAAHSPPATADTIEPQYRACDFAQANFDTFSVGASDENAATPVINLTLGDCGAELCAMKCHKSCDCRTSDGGPCGFGCPDPVDPIQELNYTAGFLICGSASATITCPDAPAGDLQQCRYNSSIFSAGDPVFTDGVGYELPLTGCAESRCAVGCISDTCTCIEPDDGSECGLCDPLKQEKPQDEQPPVPNITDDTLIEYSLKFVTCPESTAIITCTDPTLIAIDAQQQDVLATQRPCDFAEADFNNWEVDTSSVSANLTLDTCVSGGLCSVNCHSSCDCRTPDGQPCGFFCDDPENPEQQVNYSSPFMICGSAAATITCPDATGAGLEECRFLQEQFDTDTLIGASGYQLALTGCKESRCAVGCKTDTCTCVEPDDGSDCGQCDPLNQEKPPATDTNSTNSTGIAYTLDFASCPNLTSVITCTDKDLIDINAQGQQVERDQRACDFAEDEFTNWKVKTTVGASILTLEDCGSGGLCGMKCHDSCDCRTSDGAPCGFNCPDPNSENATDLVNYTSTFLICGSASASITCPDVAQGEIGTCDVLPSQVENWNEFAALGPNRPFELEVTGCKESRCAVGCRSETCTCVETDDGSECGQCDVNDQNPPPEAPPPVYKNVYEICGSASAVIVCEDTRTPDGMCDFSLEDFSRWETTSIDGTTSSQLNVTGCGKSRCPISCVPDQCSCFEPDDKSPCGNCDQAGEMPRTIDTGNNDNNSTNSSSNIDDDDFTPGGTKTFYTLDDATISCPANDACEYTTADFESGELLGQAPKDGQQPQAELKLVGEASQVAFVSRDILEVKGCVTGTGSLLGGTGGAESRRRRTQAGEAGSQTKPVACEITCTNTCACVNGDETECTQTEVDAILSQPPPEAESESAARSLKSREALPLAAVLVCCFLAWNNQ